MRAALRVARLSKTLMSALMLSMCAWSSALARSAASIASGKFVSLCTTSSTSSSDTSCSPHMAVRSVRAASASL